MYLRALRKIGSMGLSPCDDGGPEAFEDIADMVGLCGLGVHCCRWMTGGMVGMSRKGVPGIWG